MAGKLHARYDKAFGIVAGGAPAVAPESRLARAYAEGYARKRSGQAAANPHAPFTDAFAAYDQGYSDRISGYPPTHVGGS
jgi:hypothetical protein